MRECDGKKGGGMPECDKEELGCDQERETKNTWW